MILKSAKGSALPSATNPGTLDADPVLREFLRSGHGPEPDNDLGTIAADTVAPRVPGALAGQIRIHNDFDAPLLKEIADAFEVQ